MFIKLGRLQLGYEVVDRARTDSWTNGIFLLSIERPVSEPATVTGFRLYAKNVNKQHLLGIWRHQHNDSFK